MHFKGIREILKALKNGHTTVSELENISRQRIEQIKFLNAFISHKEHTQHDKSSVSRETAPLAGIPFATKDNFNSKSFPTTCASRMLRDYRPCYNATVIDKLLDAGANLMGKTNMDEFAMGSGCVESIFGPVKNPWTPGILDKDGDTGGDWHIAGGSSGGSAVAVAAGACTFALGSDTGGSVRNPASHCGVVGLKPTYGLVSRHGLISLVNSLDVPAIFARSVEDAAIVLDVLKGRDIRDSTTVDVALPGLDVALPGLNMAEPEVKGLRVGIPKESLVKGMSAEVVNAWRWAADRFADAGAHIEQVSLPNMKHSIVCYHVLSNVEVASNMARFDGVKYGHRADVDESTDAMFAISRKEGLNDTVRSRILSGNYFLLKKNRSRYYNKAREVRRLIMQDFKNSFERGELLSNGQSFTCDVLLSPVVLTDAPMHSEFIQEDNRTRCAEQDVLTQPVNMAGVPAISLPVRLSSKMMPIGLQLIGNHFSEATILKAAAFLENAAGFTNLEHRFQEQCMLPKEMKLSR